VTSRRAVFLDRDGVINELVPDPASTLPESPLRSEDVGLLPGAAAAMVALREAGWLLVGVSNQPAAAKGKVSVEQLCAVQARVLELLSAEGAQLDAFRICLHHPHGVVPELAGECACRKPAPGMLLDAARQLSIDLRESWTIGDTDADVVAGQAAGCHTVLVEHRASVHKRRGDAKPNLVAPDLGAAATVLLALPDRVN
jgi:D-glycero-D-manno-heptose 1,7-bisphosphate phosphatase